MALNKVLPRPDETFVDSQQPAFYLLRTVEGMEDKRLVRACIRERTFAVSVEGLFSGYER